MSWAEEAGGGHEGPDFELNAPEPAAPAEREETAGAATVAPPAAERIGAMVAAFVDALSSPDVNQEAYRRRIADVNAIGEREIRATSEMSNRLLDRPPRALAGLLHGDSSVGKTLIELRHTVDDLNPARYDLTGGPRKLLGLIPLGDKLRNYFDRYTKAQKHIQRILGALNEGRSELEKDNAALVQEQRSLWTEMETLRQYAYMTEKLDVALEQRNEAIAGIDAGKSRMLRQDVLFPVRQRRQEILTQLAVAAQGYAALRVIEANNDGLIRAVRTATTTTVAALRTAVTVAQALTNQRLVTDQVKAINEATSAIRESISSPLRDQMGELESLAAGTGADMGSLQRAWDNVFVALDQIDAYKRNALEAMQLAVGDLSSQIQRSNAYLERSRDADADARSDEGPTLRLS